MAKDKKHEIKGLPTPKEPGQNEEAVLQANMQAARNCPHCGREGRVVSNHLGINGHCGPCKIHWPISNSALRPEVPASTQRGISKQTSVEPDWSTAFDRDIGD